MNFFADGGVIADAVTAIGILIAFYYGATGFACTWYYRRELTSSAHSFFMKGLIPLLGGVMLWVGMILTTIQDWKPVNSYVVWNMHFAPHWQVGFAFLLGVGSFIVGVNPHARLHGLLQAVLPRRDPQPRYAGVRGRRRLARGPAA